ncbi:MAG: cation-translocating P-type ATPase [Dehalococcoidales bacterium]|nr:cation-translocating P-type ATPase [Dehalococcoidales bacterium]
MSKKTDKTKNNIASQKDDTKWYQKSIAETFKALNSGLKGLTGEEVRKRLSQYGYNELKEEKKVSPWKLLAEQFKSALIIILLVAVALSVVIGIINWEAGAGLPEEITDAIVIFAIVIACVILGFIEEYRSEKAMAALKRMAAPTATVIRDGNEIEVPAEELVPGDIVILSAGDRIPADLRLVESFNLSTQEAPLTGESTPVEKSTAVIEGVVPVGDHKNMAYTGTTVTYGRGKGIVVATGMQTEFGKIAAMLQGVGEETTPLQKNLDKVGKMLGIACLIIVAIVVLLSIIRGHIFSLQGIMDIFIWGVSLAVAAVPEALPAVVVISLSIGVQKMVKRHALVRRLSAVETLGCTTVICSDKTGTLTQDQMTVRQIYVSGRLIQITGAGYEPKGEFQIDGKVIDIKQDTDIRTFMKINALCNDTQLLSRDGKWEIKGDPTEGGLLVAAAKAGLSQDDLNSELPRIDEIPFSSERKKMTTIHNSPEGKIAYSKGAPEIVLDSCAYIMENGQKKILNENDRNRVLSTAYSMGENALRVLGMAYKPIRDNAAVRTDCEKEMVFVGLAGMIDPPRPEVKDAIKLCEKAGIKSVMITGDHKITASAIARELGILKPDGMAITGAELENLSDTEYEKIVEDIEVYARVSPANKLKIVDTFSMKGEIVAMTGDGVNDAPALKKADIGIAMGISGTDVSKEAAAMVLTDDNFASIVAAVEEGRGIFNNIKKYLIYLLSANIGEVLIMFIASLLGLPLPLVAIHLLWVNLVTDGLPALALSIDPHDPDIMKRKPRDPKSSIFTKNVLINMAVIGVIMAATMLPLFIWKLDSLGHSWHESNNPLLTEAQTMVLCAVVLFELFAVLACRSEIHSIFKIGFFSNKWLIYANLASLGLLMAVLYIPALQEPFHVVPIGWEDWLLIIPVSLTGFIAFEISKWILRKTSKSN